MSKGTITSFRVEAATNGYSLNYCIKTKVPAAVGQTYSNTDYKDVEEVFMEKDKEELIDRIGQLLGVVRDGEDEEEKEVDLPDLPAMSKEGY